MKIIKRMQQILVLSALAVTSTQVLADSYVWEISQGDSRVIVGGTLHMLKPGDYPLPVEYDAAFDVADVVVFEADIAEINSPAFGMKVAQQMMLPGEQTLQSSINADTWQALDAYAKARGFPLAGMQKFTPAFVSLMLTVLEMQKLGFSEGVDMHYHQRAQSAAKPTLGIETPDEQLGFMLAMNDIDPDKLVLATLEDLEQLPALMNDALAAWRKGDDTTLYKLMGKPLYDEVPELYEVMLTRRNQKWVHVVEALLQSPETELLLVGALHLAGPNSLLQMLKTKGVTVKRYRPETASQ